MSQKRLQSNSQLVLANTKPRSAGSLLMLLNGTVDQLVYENGGFATDLPFAELKPMSLIDAKAQAADQAPDFSALIRAGLPGFEQ